MSRSASPPPPPANGSLPAPPADSASPDVPARISAYYSLVFPDITFFLQTLTVTIGRRCLPSSTSLNGSDAPAATQSLVDVDLGPLKSVSRLHARIEYEEEEARFVLVVIGRNGAWVDGVWSGAGSRVPLGEKSQIQIASRTFHFVLPPPAALEDPPSPSSVSSMQRARSPSVDITSISPPSSLPSHSPSPRTAPVLPPGKSRSPDSRLPNTNAISRSKAPSASTSGSSSIIAPTSKKRKKASQPPPKPDVMPPKPPFTYAQLCYRAIKGMGGKATLQDICRWMMDNYDWYRFSEGAGWENSVRHNLSSGRAFKKMERSTGEHGKGFFWSVDAQYEHTFEEQEARTAAQSQSSSLTTPANNKESANKGSRRKDKAIPLDPPLKRSVKSGIGPLPPPLTSTPLASSFRTALRESCTAVLKGTAVGNVAAVPPAEVSKSEPGDPPRTVPVVPAGGMLSTLGSVALSRLAGAGMSTEPSTPSMDLSSGPSSSTPPNAVCASSSDSSIPFGTLPPSVCLPIVIGSVPTSHPSSSTSDPSPIILHNNTLVLSPVIFSSLAPEQLKALEEMGAQKALDVLQGHIVRYLKEQMGKKKRKKAVSGNVVEKGGTKTGKSNASELSSPFTTAPLPLRTYSAPTSQVPHICTETPSSALTLSNSSIDCTSTAEFSSADVRACSSPCVGNSPGASAPLLDENGLDTPIIIVDDEDEAGRAAKRRKLGNEAETRTQSKDVASAVQISQALDEDIEVEVC